MQNQPGAGSGAVSAARILTREHLIGKRFLIRTGQFTIDGDQVTMTLKWPGQDINCGHIIGHMDNDCPDAELLQAFDKAVGGTERQRGWHSTKFPIWHFTLTPGLRNVASAMIARTDADCHGNVVDGDQVQTDLDASPRTAATFELPLTYSFAQNLSDLDELFGKTNNFFVRYYEACNSIIEDRHVPDDFFFSPFATASDCVQPYTNFGMPSPLFRTWFRKVKTGGLGRDVLEVSEMSARFFKKLLFSIKVAVVEKTRRRPLWEFSQLANDIRPTFAISRSCMVGILCRLLPATSVIGVNKCAFAHATEMDWKGKVLLDQPVTLRDVFLGEEEIYAKVLDGRRVVVRGAQVDDVCMIMERRECLHIVKVVAKEEYDMEDTEFKRVEQAEQLLVGWEEDLKMIEKMWDMRRDEVRDVAMQASSVQRALRILLGRCGTIPWVTECGKGNFAFGRQMMVGIVGRSGPLRSAMVCGMCESNDVDKVEKIMSSLYANVWARVMRECVDKLYSGYLDIRYDAGEDGTMTPLMVVVSRGESEMFSIDESGVVDFCGDSEFSTAAAVRTGMWLGMRIESASGKVLREAVTDGAGQMVLRECVSDDIISLASQTGL